MTVFYDRRGSFGFAIPDGEQGTIGMIKDIAGELRCSECRAPFEPGDLVVHQEWRSEGKVRHAWYHERHASELVRQQYARWVRRNFPSP